MKNEIKILIAAIVVIIIVLVGAFALSGSNTAQPTATPTVLPVTATPTVVPAGGQGGEASATPTVTPTVTPTATPTPTPTPEPASGVKQTEFGYWITYPPLGPETWSSPHPAPSHGNVVHFDPTSATVPANYFWEKAVESNKVKPGMTYVMRDGGDMNATITVNMTLSASSNVRFGNIPSGGGDYDYYAYVTAPGDNLTQTGPNTYQLTMGPNVTEFPVAISIRAYELGSTDYPHDFPECWARLTMTGVDGGYGLGADKVYTLNVKDIPLVGFTKYEADLWSSNGQIRNDTGVFGSAYSSGNMFYVTLPVAREGDISGALPLSFDWYVDDSRTGAPEIPAGAITIQSFSFAANNDEGYVTVGIPRSYILGNDWYDIVIEIKGSDSYSAVEPEFWIYVNDD